MEACGGGVIEGAGLGAWIIGAAATGVGELGRGGSTSAAGAFDNRGERLRGVGVVMSKKPVLGGGAGGVAGAVTGLQSMEHRVIDQLDVSLVDSRLNDHLLQAPAERGTPRGALDER